MSYTLIKKNKLVVLLTLVVSQPFAEYEMAKYTINNGGGKMTGGNYEMDSSIGQVDASGTQSGGNYTLNGGFWHEANTTQTEIIFTNGFHIEGVGAFDFSFWYLRGQSRIALR